MIKNIQMATVKNLTNFYTKPALKNTDINQITKADTVTFKGLPKTEDIKKIAYFDIRDKNEENYLAEIKPNGCEYEMTTKTINQCLEENPDKFKNVEVISVLSNSKISKEFMNKMPNLKMVSVRMAGYDNVDLDHCKKNNIAVVNARGYAENSVAEFSFSLLNNLVRKVGKAQDDLKTGNTNLADYKGMDLNSKTIGIIGAGSIGSQAAKIANGYGMKVLVYNPEPDASNPEKVKQFEEKKQKLQESCNAQFVEIDDLYKQSDVISLYCPYEKNQNSKNYNHHMIDDKSIGKMKDGVLLINTARGELVDTQALYNNLASGKIGGAGLDVFEAERETIKPQQFLMKNINEKDKDTLNTMLLNYELEKMDNVIMTPHTAYNTKDAIKKRLDSTTANVSNHLQGNFTALDRIV